MLVYVVPNHDIISANLFYAFGKKGIVIEFHAVVLTICNSCSWE